MVVLGLFFAVWFLFEHLLCPSLFILSTLFIIYDGLLFPLLGLSACCLARVLEQNSAKLRHIDHPALAHLRMYGRNLIGHLALLPLMSSVLAHLMYRRNLIGHLVVPPRMSSVLRHYIIHHW